MIFRSQFDGILFRHAAVAAQSSLAGAGGVSVEVRAFAPRAAKLVVHLLASLLVDWTGTGGVAMQPFKQFI